MDGLLGRCIQSVVSEDQLDSIHAEQRLVLLDDGVLGLGEHPDQVVFVERVQPDDHRQPSDELRYESVVHQVVGVYVPPHFVGGALAPVVGHDVGLEPDALAVLERAFLDDLVDSLERAAAHEQDVVRTDLEEVLVRMLPSALRRNVGDAPFDDLEQRLLHALARHVARYGRIGALARYLVDLVYVDDAVLGAGYVEIRGLDESQQDILHVLADVSGLGQSGRVGNGERHFEDVRQVLRQVCLARSRRPQHQDVSLLELDVVVRLVV